MPYSIDPAADGGRWTRTDFGLRPESFVFLFYFDAHSFVERKNPVGLIRAFRKAFSKSEDVYLLIKCSHGKRSMLRILNKACENHPNITIVDAILSRAALVALLSKCDTYVSLHRSEGFGLTLSEAMNLGKPVIATGYSSNLDFMNDSNSFLVKYKLVELKKRYGPYQEGFRWAEPDVSHAAELMREVYQDRERALMIGEQGRRDIRRLLHPKVIGSMMQSRLAEIAQITGLGRERSGASTAVSSARPGNR
jgi:glycosyltransferase involved in cell wall biosynthesis